MYLTRNKQRHLLSKTCLKNNGLWKLMLIRKLRSRSSFSIVKGTLNSLATTPPRENSEQSKLKLAKREIKSSFIPTSKRRRL